MNTTTREIEQLLSLADVARRLPSPRPGKRTHLSTVYRLIVKHRIPVVRRGRYRFIREADLALLFEDEPPGRDPKPRGRPPNRTAGQLWAEEELRKRGML